MSDNAPKLGTMGAVQLLEIFDNQESKLAGESVEAWSYREAERRPEGKALEHWLRAEALVYGKAVLLRPVNARGVLP